MTSTALNIFDISNIEITCVANGTTFSFVTTNSTGTRLVAIGTVITGSTTNNYIWYANAKTKGNW